MFKKDCERIIEIQFKIIKENNKSINSLYLQEHTKNVPSCRVRRNSSWFIRVVH